MINSVGFSPVNNAAFRGKAKTATTAVEIIVKDARKLQQNLFQCKSPLSRNKAIVRFERKIEQGFDEGKITPEDVVDASKILGDTQGGVYLQRYISRPPLELQPFKFKMPVPNIYTH